nr:MAG TPA: hypothetical protein [Caudoviricetes sp.]
MGATLTPPPRATLTPPSTPLWDVTNVTAVRVDRRVDTP